MHIPLLVLAEIMILYGVSGFNSPRHMRLSISMVEDNTSYRSMRDRRRDGRLTSIQTKQPLTSIFQQKAMAINFEPNEDAEPFQISDSHELPFISNKHITFHAFDDLFPETNLGEIFDSNSQFRTSLRKAARRDFFNEYAHGKCNSLNNIEISMMSNWRKNNVYANIDEVFTQYNVSNLNGVAFMQVLTSFCLQGEHTFGSWMDIVGIKEKYVPHSWHQDSGLNQFTVMVGFPKENHFEGTGVFSHAVKLSHRLCLPSNTGKEPVLWKGESFPESTMMRPTYRRGKEVMVYNDRDVFHSAPDFAIRESIWRFM